MLPTRPRRRSLLVAALSLAVVPLGACRGRRRSLDEQARALVSGLETAIEERDYDATRQLLAPGFRGPEDMDRRAALLLLRARLQGRSAVHLVTRVITLELEERSGPWRVEVVAAMAAVPVTIEDLPNIEADVHRFFLELVSSEDGRSMLVSAARWAPARLLDFQ